MTRYLVVGAGAVGGVIGGRLAQYGQDVALVARGRHLAAILANGLRIDDPDGSVSVPVPAFATPAEAGLRMGDVVILATKTQDSGPVLDAIAAAAPKGIDIPIVCGQNGVENERLALRRFVDVYAMCVMLPATHLEPGVVEAASAPVTGILDVGRYPSGVDAVTEALAAALEASGFSARPDPLIMRQKYAKLLMNLGNALEAACGPAGRAEGRDLFRRARDEARACLAAAGTLTASEEEDRARRGDLLSIREVNGRERGGGSSWQSLARGSGSVEADFLNGEIVLLGRLHGIATPVNTLLQRVANRLARDGAPPGSLTVAALRDELA